MAALFLRSEGDSRSWQVWPVAEVIPAGAIREVSVCLFELRDCDQALNADLLIDDLPVEALRSRQSQTALWRWMPGFHAGVAEATLRIPGTGPRRFDITIDPDIRKLTRDDFDAMVREILEDSQALFSLSAFRTGIARQAGNRPPPLARLEFLRSRADEILRCMKDMARSPRHFLQAEEITLPAHRARRATGVEIMRSFRSGVVRTETSAPSRLPAALAGRLPAQIRVRQRRQSVDIAEHRQIKACLVSWAAWLNGMADTLGRPDRNSDAELRTTAEHWAVRTRHLARRLNDASRAGFMREVGEGPSTLHMSALFRSDPVYHCFYRLWQDMNLGLAAFSGDFLQMPLARTFELYELWCFLRLLRTAAVEHCPGGMDLTSLFLNDTAGGVTIAAGSVVLPVGPDMVLCFQRRYREYWTELGGEGSFSRTMVPDVVLSVARPGGLTRQLIVLDAKYRINEGLNEALNSIHTYRDALVQETPDGQPEGIVTAAYLLTPHVPVLGNDFPSTPLPGRLFHPRYREKFRFGAVTLRPGMSAADLRVCLRTILADASAGAAND
jgi:hypothetical protein